MVILYIYMHTCHRHRHITQTHALNQAKEAAGNASS
jgi:hypothetical protein